MEHICDSFNTEFVNKQANRPTQQTLDDAIKHDNPNNGDSTQWLRGIAIGVSFGH